MNIAAKLIDMLADAARESLGISRSAQLASQIHKLTEQTDSAVVCTALLAVVALRVDASPTAVRGKHNIAAAFVDMLADAGDRETLVLGMQMLATIMRQQGIAELTVGCPEMDKSTSGPMCMHVSSSGSVTEVPPAKGTA